MKILSLGVTQQNPRLEAKIEKIFNMDILRLKIDNDLWGFNVVLLNQLIFSAYVVPKYGCDSFISYIWRNILLEWGTEQIDRVDDYLQMLKKKRDQRFKELPDFWKKVTNRQVEITNSGLIFNEKLKLNDDKIIQWLDEMGSLYFLNKLGKQLFNDYFKDYWEEYPPENMDES